MQLWQGDCLVESERIESGTVDLILTDPPYGIISNYKNCEWDWAIKPSGLYDISNRILRKNGKLVLFSMEPYTSKLITESIPNIPFSYRAIWEKPVHGNGCHFKCNKAMLGYYEDVLVFSKMHDTDAVHPLRPYFKEVMQFIGLNLKQINAELGHRRAEHTFYVTPTQAVKKEIGQKVDHTFRTGSTQFSVCTEPTYNELIRVFNIDKMAGFREFADLKQIDNQFKKDLPSVFNLWQGGKYKSNILKYKKDYDGYHPTQKPILLLEDLIKTFSNEGDLVVDLTMGSGSTGVACVNTNREFIGIEKEAEYVDIARKRIEEQQPSLL